MRCGLQWLEVGWAGLGTVMTQRFRTGGHSEVRVWRPELCLRSLLR